MPAVTSTLLQTSRNALAAPAPVFLTSCPRQSVLLLGIGFLCGGFSAYMDLDAAFKRGKGSTYLFSNKVSLAFLIGNGLLATVILGVSLGTPKDGFINTAIQVDSPWAKLLVLALGVQGIIRGKIFSLGQADYAVGPAIIYEFLRGMVLDEIGEYLTRIKIQISNRYKTSCANWRSFPDDLSAYVLGLADLNAKKDNLESLKREYEAFQVPFKNGAFPYPEEAVPPLIRWAMDNAGIRNVQRFVDEGLKK